LINVSFRLELDALLVPLSGLRNVAAGNLLARKKQKAGLISACLTSLPSTYRGTAIYAMPIFPSALDKLDRL
jgi:hypothetical protein